MTREEKIELLEFLRQGLIIIARVKSDYDIVEALGAAISALKGPTREQVEKVWRGEWIHKRSPYDYKIFVCKKCGKQISIQGENMDFCPACGAAQTDEAVEMVMERLNKLEETKK